MLSSASAVSDAVSTAPSASASAALWFWDLLPVVENVWSHVWWTGTTAEVLKGMGDLWVAETGMLWCSVSLRFLVFMVPEGSAAPFGGSAGAGTVSAGGDMASAPAPHGVPVFCRFVLPCQIFLPPIKTVGSTIRQRKMLPVKLWFINVYTYHNPKPTLTVMQIQ